MTNMPLHLFEDNDFLTNTFNAIPFPIMVVDNDVRMLFWNSAALRLLGSEEIYRQKGGDILHCLHSFESNEGCGHGEACKTCIIRNSVNESGQGKKIYRKKAVMELRKTNSTIEVPILVTTSPFEYDNKSLTLLMIEDIQELMQISGILPICSNCKKIRIGENQWQQVEEYIKTHIIDVKFTHGMCPDCIDKLYPDYGINAKK
jgi:hypothetical protein